ncbi:hypothetical protein [Treponema sp. R80B11-R83G3]
MAICKNSKTAIQIIKTITENMRDGTQKTALQSVAEWIHEHAYDIPDDPKERRRTAEQLRRELGLKYAAFGTTEKR